MKYYPINEELARRANMMNSYFDFVPGRATQFYRAEVDEAAALAERQKRQVDPMYHEKIDGLLDTFARKLAENVNRRNEIATRVPSILVAGGSNFPVRKKEKQNRADDAAMEEYQQIRGLLDKIRGTGRGGISADDPAAVDKLEVKLKGLEALQEQMKAVNVYHSEHGTLDGCPQLSSEELEELKAGMARSWRAEPKPYETFLLANKTREAVHDAPISQCDRVPKPNQPVVKTKDAYVRRQADGRAQLGHESVSTRSVVEPVGTDLPAQPTIKTRDSDTLRSQVQYQSIIPNLQNRETTRQISERVSS